MALLSNGVGKFYFWGGCFEGFFNFLCVMYCAFK